MARKPQKKPDPRAVVDLIREIEKRSPPEAIPTNSGTGILAEIENRFAANPGMTNPPERGSNSSAGLLASANGRSAGASGSGFKGGLLGVGSSQIGGLLGERAPAAPKSAPPAPATPGSSSLLGRVGNFADDFLFGGAAGEASAARREREQQQALDAAHRDAFAFATQGGEGLNPALYAQRMAQLGQAPDMAGLMSLEGLTDSQDVRGYRGRQERRAVTGAAYAPVLAAQPEQRPAMMDAAGSYLQSIEGFEPMTSPEMAVSGAIGAGAFLDNDRGERALAEQRRAAMAGEQYRSDDFRFRQNVDGRNFDYQRQRDAADDQYRNSRAAAEDAYRQWEQQNSFSRSDIEGQVLRKAIQGGAASLTPEEKQVYDRAVTVASMGGGWGMPMGGGLPGVGQPQPQPQAAPPMGDGRSRAAPATVETAEDFERLPVGAWFINPADGRVLQKAN